MKFQEIALVVGLAQFVFAISAYFGWLIPMYTGIITAHGLVLLTVALTFYLKKKNSKLTEYFIGISIVSLIVLPAALSKVGSIVSMNTMMICSLLYGIVYLLLSISEIKKSKKQSQVI